MRCTMHGHQLSSFSVQLLQLLCWSLQSSCSVPQHSNCPYIDCHGLVSPKKFWALPAWGVSYIPSWAVVLFLPRLLYLDLESWDICIHLFPLHLLFSCWVAKSFTSNHLSSLQNQHPAFLKTHSKSLLIVCTVFTRDSTWLSLFPNSFKSSINNWWFNHCISYDVAFF